MTALSRQLPRERIIRWDDPFSTARPFRDDAGESSPWSRGSSRASTAKTGLPSPKYVLPHGRLIGMLAGRNFGKALVHLS